MGMADNKTGVLRPKVGISRPVNAIGSALKAATSQKLIISRIVPQRFRKWISPRQKYQLEFLQRLVVVIRKMRRNSR
jgi:hypothetical protein